MTEQTERSGCLLAILKLLGISPISPAPLPYRRKDYLLTKAERAFFSVLNAAVQNRYLMFAKVRLADLVWLPKGTTSRQAHFNRVQSKHVDFLLCDHDTIRPLLCIELDDSSHSRADRVTRDKFLDSALQAAGLPLVRFRASAAYNAAELRQRIEAALR